MDLPAPSHEFCIDLAEAIDDLRLRPYALALYVHVKRRAGDSGVCDDTLRELAVHCRMGEWRVTESLRELTGRGLIRVETGDWQQYIFIVDIESQGEVL